ncbi:hypothetical protein [Halorarum halobium]|uniref:hypothetical protein n=1 Tax=Halorarum halobium TaxID=3075121 RepID=UPI0028A83EC2|nr:hypothetical protein [Halobaculum sp. XH14]
MSNTTPRAGESDDDADDAHLQDVEDGAGCTEIWETLSERREAENADAADAE